MEVIHEIVGYFERVKFAEKYKKQGNKYVNGLFILLY